MSGWSAGSTRRLNSSALSPIASASDSRPMAKYLKASWIIVVPARQATNHSVTFTYTSTAHKPLTYVRMIRQHATPEF